MRRVIAPVRGMTAADVIDSIIVAAGVIALLACPIWLPASDLVSDTGNPNLTHNDLLQAISRPAGDGGQ